MLKMTIMSVHLWISRRAADELGDDLKLILIIDLWSVRQLTSDQFVGTYRGIVLQRRNEFVPASSFAFANSSPENRTILAVPFKETLAFPVASSITLLAVVQTFHQYAGLSILKWESRPLAEALSLADL